MGEEVEITTFFSYVQMFFLIFVTFLKIGGEVAVAIGAHAGEGHMQFGKDLLLVFVLKVEHAEPIVFLEKRRQRLGIALGRMAE